jgi:hypothetical protein
LTRPDTVNHPDHYNAGKIEVIDAIEDWRLGFHLGNVVKYIARAPHKGDELGDLRKAQWYINRRIDSMRAQSYREPKPPTPEAGPAEDADGWIEWGGGECPVEPTTSVVATCGDGDEYGPCEASTIEWGWLDDGPCSDIVRYRIHKPTP